MQTSGVKIYSAFLGLVSITVTARILGPDGRGELVAITTWVTTFSTFIYFSLGQVAVYQASRSIGQSWLPDAYHTLLSFSVIGTIIGWGVALILHEGPWESIFGDITPAWLLLGFLMLPFRIWEQYSSSLLMALERLDIHNRYLFIGSSAGFFLTMFLLLIIGLGVEGVLSSQLFGQVVIAAGGISLIHKYAGGWSKPRAKEMLQYLGNGSKLHMNAVGMFFITGSDILMLNYYQGSAQTAFYQLGVQLMGVMLLIPQAAQMVVYGKVSDQGPDRAWKDHRKVLINMTIFVAFGAVVAGGTAQWWLIFLVGDEFLPAVDIFRWLLLASIGMTFSTIMAPQWVARGLFTSISTLTLTLGLLNLTLNIFWIPSYGAYGAVYATLITYTISVFVNGIMALHCQRKYKVVGSTHE